MSEETERLWNKSYLALSQIISKQEIDMIDDVFKQRFFSGNRAKKFDDLYAELLKESDQDKLEKASQEMLTQDLTALRETFFAVLMDTLQKLKFQNETIAQERLFYMEQLK